MAVCLPPSLSVPAGPPPGPPDCKPTQHQAHHHTIRPAWLCLEDSSTFFLFFFE